jgi:protein TonB
MKGRRVKRTSGSWLRHLGMRVFSALGAIALTAVIFLILPMLQTIGGPPARDLLLQTVETAETPPPPPPPELAPEQEPPPEAPPELEEQAPPLDLGQLELALNPIPGDGAAGEFAVKLLTPGAQGGEIADGGVEQIFSLADLDQRPRPIFQTPPHYPPELRRSRRQGTVHVVFLVDPQGRVTSPKVEKSTDPAFERVALEAVRQWRFEPGTRKGEKVQFKMRVPITFSAG